MTPDDVAKAFETRFVAALAPKATNADFDKLRQFIEKVPGPDAAQACLRRYLELFGKHENTATRSRTLAAFYLVLKRRIEVAGPAMRLPPWTPRSATRASRCPRCRSGSPRSTLPTGRESWIS